MTKALVGLAIVVGLLVAWLFFGLIYGKLHAWKKARRRGSTEIRLFVEQFENHGIPAGVAYAVHRHLTDWMKPVRRRFPISPGDDIADVYGIVDEDLIDFIADILKSTDRDFPGPSDAIHGADVFTVTDLVRFVAGCPQRAQF